MNKELMAEYGEACINFEIAQNRMLELKRKIAEEMQKPKPEKADGN
jgi:hypothetical protein